MAYTTIDDPTIYFNTILWTGNGNSSRSITGVGFAPDMVWWKGRDTTYDHRLIDTVRSGTYPKLLYPNQNIAESEDANNAEAIGSDGFTIGSGNAVNQSGKTYVAWNWKAGGSASSNSDGDETTSVSVNQTAGFSIVSYTGTGSVDTFGHGLGAKPNVMIQKKRSGSAAWTVYHDKIASDPATDYLYLSSNAAVGDYADHFNDTEPTSSVFTLGTDTSVNGSGATNIMYCFAEKKGYSKFGSYTGNGNTDGAFIYTGFRPAWIIGKRTDVTNNWYIFDNKRNTFNVTDAKLRADESSAENVNSGKTIDIVSTGVKIRSSDEEFNASGGTYVYMAFAESPFVNSNGIPNNAR